MAEALVWLLALWLVGAGLARIVLSVQVSKLVRGEWLLTLSGVLALALGILFFARPGAGRLTPVFWIAIGALVSGALQIGGALRLGKLRSRSRCRAAVRVQRA
jgi:uncharacterized membrane protein HdeD (DUF308 family)